MTLSKAPKVAVITSITGQDGADLPGFLLNKGHEVRGIKRRTSLFNTDQIDHPHQDPHLEGPVNRPHVSRALQS
jgi:GDPmannose 4,6-dehydratase